MTANGQAYLPPADAGELYREYGSYVRGLVRKLLGSDCRPQDAEDVAADIMEKLVKRDVISMYDPGYVSERNGSPVTWRAFLSAQVASRIPGKREQVARVTSREPLLCDASAGEGGGRWVDIFGGGVWDDYPSLSDTEAYQRMRDYLATVPSQPGPCSLLALFNDLTGRIEGGKQPSKAYVQRRFGLTAAEAALKLEELKAALSEAVNAGPLPKFEVGGMVLSAAAVRSAVDALRAARGNRVRPAFADAGHVLAAAGTKWYLGFAQEELRLFPELRRPKGTHAPGGHGDHIKRALIHRLERMLAEAGTGECDEGESPLDRLEAELWHLTDDPGKVDEILSLARVAYS